MAPIRTWMLLLCALAALPADDQAPAWRDDFDAAVQEAEGKPLALLFSLEGCEWCQRTLSDSDASPEVRQALKQVVGIAVKAEEHRDLVAHLGIEAYPSLVLVNRKMELVRIIRGYQPAADLATALRVLALHGDQDGARPLVLRGTVDVRALARGDKAVENLIALLGSGEVRTRSQAREALARIPTAVGALFQALADPRLGVRVDAAAVLERLTGDATGYDAFAPVAQRTAAIAAWRTRAATTLPGGAAP